jgi:predicted dithiol-disulfide oxidoreductase (DUF899 family)
MLHKCDTNFVMVSRAPLSKLEAYKERQGWRLPWVSSFGSDFNYDFHVTNDETIAPVEYNYRNNAELEATKVPNAISGEEIVPAASSATNSAPVQLAFPSGNGRVRQKSVGCLLWRWCSLPSLRQRNLLPRLLGGSPAWPKRLSG